MSEKEIETFCPSNRQEWRQWLQENHQSKQAVTREKRVGEVVAHVLQSITKENK